MPFLLILLLWIALEVGLMIHVSDWLGGSAVTLWMLAAAVVGVTLIRRQGLRAISELRASTGRGELPAQTLIESLVVLLAGLLLILPGLISDVLAVLLLIGPRRRLARGLGSGLAQARPDLKQPVTLEGQYERKS